jgi:hypothetical protein
MKRIYIPPGGYGTADGRVFSKSEVTKAVTRYARKHGFYTRTVRTMTDLKRAAMKEYVS